MTRADGNDGASLSTISQIKSRISSQCSEMGPEGTRLDIQGQVIVSTTVIFQYFLTRKTKIF